MLDLLMAAGSAILSGGATGLLGVGLQRFFDHKAKVAELEVLKEQNTHEVAMRDKDAAIMAQEWASRTKVAEVEAESAGNVADAAAFAKSYDLEPKRYAEGVKLTRGQGWIMTLVDALRGIIRPGLTLYLCAITTLVYLDAREVMGKLVVPADVAAAQVNTIVQTVLYLTTTCVLWWFGTRPAKATPKSQ